jgi:hypothetical protein
VVTVRLGRFERERFVTELCEKALTSRRTEGAALISISNLDARGRVRAKGEEARRIAQIRTLDGLSHRLSLLVAS